MISTRKKTLLRQIQELEQENQQYHFALVYSLFDLEATRRERDEVREEVELLRESLLDKFDDENEGDGVGTS